MGQEFSFGLLPVADTPHSARCGDDRVKITWSHHHPGGLLQGRHLTRFPGRHRTDLKQKQQEAARPAGVAGAAMQLAAGDPAAPEPGSTRQ